MKIKLPNVSFEVTSSCNLKCRYCYNHWKSEKDPSPSPSSYKVALKTLKQLLKIADVEHITFTGGEPLMAERFLELVLYVRMKGIMVTVISNGNFSDMSVYKQLVDLGVSLFELPIHSYDAQNHDYLTRHLGSREKSVEIITNLLKLKVEVVSVVVLTKINCKDVGKTLEYISSLGIRRVMVNRFNIGGQGVNEIKELLMTREELIGAYQVMSEKASELNLSISSNVCTPICVLNPKEYRGIRFSSCSFEFSERPITLNYNGDLRFCNHSPIVLGNIHLTSLDTILNSSAVSQWKSIVPQFCADCKAYNKCKAGCRAASEQMGLTLTYPDPIIDFVELDKELLKELKPVPNTRSYTIGGK